MGEESHAYYLLWLLTSSIRTQNIIRWKKNEKNKEQSWILILLLHILIVILIKPWKRKRKTREDWLFLKTDKAMLVATGAQCFIWTRNSLHSSISTSLTLLVLHYYIYSNVVHACVPSLTRIIRQPSGEMAILVKFKCPSIGSVSDLLLQNREQKVTSISVLFRL